MFKIENLKPFQPDPNVLRCELLITTWMRLHSFVDGAKFTLICDPWRGLNSSILRNAANRLTEPWRVPVSTTLLRLAEVQRRTGLTKTILYHKIKARTFPASIP